MNHSEILNSEIQRIFYTNYEKYNIPNIINAVGKIKIFMNDIKATDNEIRVELFDGDIPRIIFNNGKRDQSVCTVWIILAGFEEIDIDFLALLLKDSLYGAAHQTDVNNKQGKSIMELILESNPYLTEEIKLWLKLQ